MRGMPVKRMSKDAAQMESNGLIPPEEKRYGELKLVPGIWSRFNGPKFWPAFNSKGHDSCIFEGCKCRKKWGTPKK